MANKKEINTKSGERLKELIQSLGMTYADFGESVNLSERTINAYVTCARRLTEDSARIIARKYPVVRHEWLMGWDDYKTESEVIEAKLFIEAEKIGRDELEWIDREFKVGQILRCLKCDLEPMFVIEEEIKGEQLLKLPSVSKEKKFREICELISSDEDMFLYDYFSARTADEIYQKIKEIKNQREQESNPLPCGITQEDYDRIIEDEREAARTWEEFKEEYIVKEHYYFRDENKKILGEISGKKYVAFVDELYNVVNALIKYHLPFEQED